MTVTNFAESEDRKIEELSKIVADPTPEAESALSGEAAEGLELVIVSAEFARVLAPACALFTLKKKNKRRVINNDLKILFTG